MVSHAEKASFTAKMAQEHLTEEGYKSFLNQAYGIFVAGRISAIQEKCLREAYSNLLRTNRKGA